jgi:hypothetical protein
MRATKITKYFDYNNKNPLNFFPNRKTKEDPQINNSTPSKNSNNSTISRPYVSSFDTINIQLETKYYNIGSTIEYSIYFNNHSQLDIKGSVTNVGSNINGDLIALHETLKYIVYHPSISQKINKYKFNIYTHSKTISNIYKLDISKLDSNLYTKIQSLINCIKHISIEYWNPI